MNDISREMLVYEPEIKIRTKIAPPVKLRGWSQADVAAKIGTDSKAISRWERGEAVPRPYFIQKLVELFGKDAQELGLMEMAEEQTILSLERRRLYSEMCGSFWPNSFIDYPS